MWHEDVRIVAPENCKKRLCLYSPSPDGFTCPPCKQRQYKVVHKKACKGCCLLKIRNVFGS